MGSQWSEKKIFSISMVKNEEDIIESFIRYHLNIFDGMVIIDNFSTDDTFTIMERIKSEGVPLQIIRDTSLEWIPDRKLNQILYETFENFNAHLILPLDADEFLISSNYADHPREILDSIDDLDSILHVDRVRYVPSKTDNQAEYFIPRKITHVCTDRYNISPKVMVSSMIKNCHRPLLTVGNHSLIFENKISIQKKLVKELSLAHFPIRSIDQFKSKILVGGINVLTRPHRKPRESVHRLELLKKIKENPDITYDDLITMAEEYSVRNLSPDIPITTVNKPINLGFCSDLQLKYTKPHQVNVLRDLIENAEKLAEDYAKLKMEWMRMKGTELNLLNDKNP